VKIRDAEPGDLERLLQLYGLLEGPYRGIKATDGDEAAHRFTRILLDPNQRTIVAEIDGKVVGTLVVAILPNLAHGGAPYAVVENVVVDEEHRGEGIGRALMHDALALARETGAYKLTLSTNARRKEAHEFYRSLGMKETHAGFEVGP
jgi:GNAT superfamily N-acetyltransferase